MFKNTAGAATAAKTDSAGRIILSTGGATYKRAIVNVAASQTDSAVVTAVTGKKIRVVSLFAITGASATTVTFNSKPAGSGTAISPALAFGANGGVVLPINQDGWFETASGQGLSVTTSAGATTGIEVGYVEV